MNVNNNIPTASLLPPVSAPSLSFIALALNNISAICFDELSAVWYEPIKDGASKLDICVLN